MFREMRRGKQQVSDQECKLLLRREKRAVLAVNGDDGYPYAQPINFYYDEEENSIYFHCAKSGHKIDAMNRDDKVCFTLWNHGYKVDGHWEWNVTSVVAFGRVNLVTEADVVVDRVRKLARKYYPSEEEIDRVMAGHLDRLQLYVIKIEHMTGKLVKES